MIRVLIADDQPLMRAGLRLIFEPERDIEVVADAGNGAEAVRLCQTLRPDVAIFDIRMPVLRDAFSLVPEYLRIFRAERR